MIAIAVAILVAILVAPAHAEDQPSAQAKSPAETKSSADTAPAGHGQDDASDLAKKTQNPVADLISFPLQENLDYEIGPHERARSTLNIQPVIP